MKTTDTTIARVLTALADGPLRGMATREELLSRYGMSDTTRSNCLRELMRRSLVHAAQAGPGRSVSYCITRSGKNWLRRYRNANQALLQGMQEEFPITLGHGSVKVDLKSLQVDPMMSPDFLRLTCSPSLGRLIFERVHDESRHFVPFIKVPTTMKFTLRLNVETTMPQEIRELIYLIVTAREKREEWQWQAEKLSPHPIHLKTKAGPPPEAIKYFSSCPMAPLEFTILGGNKLLYDTIKSDLVSFTEAKWELLPTALKGRIKVAWQKERADQLRLKHLRQHTTELDKPSFFYDPDFRFLGDQGETDLSHLDEVRRYNDLSKSTEVRRWFDYLHEITGYWIFAREERVQHGIGMLISEELLSERAICQQWRIYRTREKVIDQNSRSLLYFACSNNDIMLLWQSVFSSESDFRHEIGSSRIDDSQWFGIWEACKDGIWGRLSELHPTSLGGYSLYAALDRLYDRWARARKPKLSTHNMASVINRIRQHILRCKRGKYTPRSDDNIMSKLNEYLNDVDWGF